MEDIRLEDIRWIGLFAALLPMALTDLLFLKISAAWTVLWMAAAVAFDLISGWNAVQMGLCLLPGVLLWLIKGRSKGIGSGDVAAVFMIGAVCGWRQCLEIMLGGSLLCLVCMAVIRRKKEAPFLTWTALAAYLSWLSGAVCTA